jgi:hypothetical protein
MERAYCEHPHRLGRPRPGRPLQADSFARPVAPHDREARSVGPVSHGLGGLLARRARHSAVLDQGRRDANDPSSCAGGALGRDVNTARCEIARGHCLRRRRFVAVVRVVRFDPGRIRRDWHGKGIRAALLVEGLDQALSKASIPRNRLSRVSRLPRVIRSRMRAAHLEPLPAISADLVTNDHAACSTNTWRPVRNYPARATVISVLALAQRILPAEQEPNRSLVFGGVRTHADEDAGMIARGRAVVCR